MKHSQRVQFWEAVYDRLNDVFFSGKAPTSVTLTVGFPSKKRSGKHLTVGQCSFDCFVDHDDKSGAQNIITLHPLQGDDLVRQASTLLHEMIHHTLPPEVKHGKRFKAECDRVGLCEPYQATEPDLTCQRTLQRVLDEVEAELGFRAVGHYMPPEPPEKKPTQNRKVACKCENPQRILSITQGKLDQGAIRCGVCQRDFEVIEDDPANRG